MQNSISERQNMEHQLDKLAARNQLQIASQRLIFIRIGIVVVMPIAMSFCSTWVEEMSSISALYALFILLIDATILELVQDTQKLLIAKCQESFDCYLFELQWSNIVAGSKPNPETIAKLSRESQINSVRYAQLRDWYPSAIERLPLDLAIPVCQRSNCWWDIGLRRIYLYTIIALAGTIAVGLIAIGFYSDITVEKFVLCILCPLTPALLWSVREYRLHAKAIELSNQLKLQAEDLIEQVRYGRITALESQWRARALQDGIFTRRRNSPVVLDAFYSKRRSEYQQRSIVAVEEFVTQWLSDSALA